jgi:predicted O-linked N-acetylglucosamine transferase (SPINDLY family)
LLNNLGESLRQQGEMHAAIDATQQAVNLAPDSYEMRLHLGRYLGVVDRREDAKRELGRLIEKHPARPEAYCGLGRMYLEIGEYRQAEFNFRRAVDRDPNSYAAHGTLLYMLSSKAGVSQQEVFDEHKKWGQRHGNVQRLRSDAQWRQLRDRSKDRKLKIGFVSPDFRNHVVKYFFEPVLQLMDRSQFEVYCYGEVYSPDTGTARLQELSDHWQFTVGLSDEQVAKHVLNDEIDILVDLAGHTGGNRVRVFAFKPAPVQVTWLGYPNTTGLEAIDYRLSCETQNPIGEPSYHTEELFRMPNASFCFAEPKNAPPVNALPASAEGEVTFGALHRPEKVSEDTLDLWAGVLKACPAARMIVFHTQFNDVSMPMVVDGLAQRGIDQQRVSVESDPGDVHYLEIYHRIDIALDVVPWAGSTTTMEALWMGVPVVAFYGTQRSSRATAVIMKNVGQESLIADSTDGYCELVSKLSCDLERLRMLRGSLRSAVSATITDGKRFTIDLENSFREMWHRWCDSE